MPLSSPSRRVTTMTKTSLSTHALVAIAAFLRDIALATSSFPIRLALPNPSHAASNHHLDTEDNNNNYVTDITYHGSSDCDHPHNPTSTSNGSKCKIVYDPSGGFQR